MTNWNVAAPAELDDTQEIDLTEPDPEDDADPTEPGPNPYADGATEVPDA